MKASRIQMLLLLLAACLILGSCSDSDSSVTTPNIDTAPPAMPTGLESCTGDCVVKLHWDPNTTDNDLAGFRVYRFAFGQVWRLTHTPLTGVTFVDRAPLATQCTYGVTAVDENGNESGWTTIEVNCRIIDQDLHRQ